MVQKLLRKARKGAKIVYVPGNHDEFFRDFYGTHFGGIEVRETALHVAADGKRYLVIHGDVFDMVVRHAKWLALVGDWAYTLAMTVSELCQLRSAAGSGSPTGRCLPGQSKRSSTRSTSSANIEETLVAEAGRNGVDGVDLRPYPQRGAARNERDHLHQHRRLGRKLHSRQSSISTAASRLIDWTMQSRALNRQRAIAAPIWRRRAA